MIVVTLKRDNCIGCNYCHEVAPSYFGMNESDGKSDLFESTEKRGFHTHKSYDPSAFVECKLAEESCPVGIISTKQV